MLDSLRRIVQEVNSAVDLAAALDVIVVRVCEVMGTGVCTVYLHDPETDRHVFMATEGLNKAQAGKVSLGRDEGLVALVAKREEPVNLEAAEQHPSFYALPGIGEEAYSAFLGVPIIHRRRVLGVLVVQQQQRRRFDESEEAFLVTLSAQLAAVIAHAEATGVLFQVGVGGSRGTATFQGIAGAPGIAIGECLVVSLTAELNTVPSRTCADPDAEVAFFRQCLGHVRDDIRRLATMMAPQLRPEENALFDVYLSMLDDNALGQEVVDRILGGEWAQGALSQVMLEHVRTFERVEDPYLRERAVDVKDLGRRVLSYLQAATTDEREYPAHTVLVGEELTASMLAEVPEGRLVGLVSVRGSVNSHLAIMARALGIPTVVGAEDIPFTRLDHQQVIVDGYSGTVVCNPSTELCEQYQALRDQERQFNADIEALGDEPCETLDGHRVTLMVNTGLITEVTHSLKQGAEGVGLYRTEIPFLLRDRFPSEEEQRRIYREQLEAFHPLPVTMRTLDIGGDKALPYFPIKEDNPFLGWRGIRVTLDHPEIYLAQVRAMMKASEGLDNLRIMLPMISSTFELEEALELLYRAHDELLDDGLQVVLPAVGVMVEVPAAVYQARELARQVDFLSVGSNDLTQYLLAVDRNNSRVADLYHSYHPAVLHALKLVADAAHAEGKQVSICGELASDPGAALMLMAMGYDTLSMGVNSLARSKYVIRQVTTAQAQQLLDRVLELHSARHIQRVVDEALREFGVSPLLRPAIVV
jgi:phosphotransferase system enzyme I (PtsP)